MYIITMLQNIAAWWQNLIINIVIKLLTDWPINNMLYFLRDDLSAMFWWYLRIAVDRLPKSKILLLTFWSYLRYHVRATGIKSYPNTTGCDKIALTHRTLFRILKLLLGMFVSMDEGSMWQDFAKRPVIWHWTLHDKSAVRKPYLPLDPEAQNTGTEMKNPGHEDASRQIQRSEIKWRWRIIFFFIATIRVGSAIVLNILFYHRWASLQP